MWSPQYEITHYLLGTIRQISETTKEIESYPIPSSKLKELKLAALEQSSYASTSIEGNPLPLTDVKKLLKSQPQKARDTEKEVLNYNQALVQIFKQIQDKKFRFSAKNFEKVQGIVTKDLLSNPFDIGSMRKKPVIIRNPKEPEKIVFLPPDHQDVVLLCKELFDFVNDHIKKIDPIILAGLFHRQSVIIHPFMDGNGRSTRIMTTALLGLSGLDIFNLFSFENYYNQNVTRYFQKVGLQGNYYDLEKKIDHTDWLEYFAEGILDELKRVQKTLPSEQVLLHKHHHQVLDYVREHGNITQRQYGSISTRSLASRKKDFLFLVENDFLETKKGGRSTYYVLKGK